MPYKLSASVSRRSGVAIIYVVISLVAMLAFCSLAVDLGRVQTSKTELRRASMPRHAPARLSCRRDLRDPN